MKKVTILSLHLNTGGIEKCIADLANFLSRSYEVEIVSVYKIKNKPSFKINDNVTIKYLTNRRPNEKEFYDALKKKNILSLFKEACSGIKTLYLRKHSTIKYIKKCDSDFIISTRVLFNKWLGRYGKCLVKIAWEHNHYHGNISYADEVVESCKNIDKLVLVSKSLKEFYEDRFQEKGYKCKCEFIPNAIDYIPDDINKLDNNNIVSVGRLEAEKGFLDLIEVFNIASKKNPNLHLDIVGDGREKNKIIKKIKEYKIEDKVTMHGNLNSSEVHEILANSSLYVMCSYTESFGIVLIEAMSHGLACVAFSSAEGAMDLIKDKNLLVDNRDFNKMSTLINVILNNREYLKEIGYKNRGFSLNYDIEKVMKLWKKILK